MKRDIVVIGASAGGVEALATVVAGLPPDFRASVFVVLHVWPHAPSLLHEILDAAGPLPARAAVNGAPIEPGTIHVAVPDCHLLLEPDRMRLAHGPKENYARPAVDVLFRSAAWALGPRVVGVVLTGNLDDGTAGLWAVKERGGIAIAQSPDEASYPSMPRSAVRRVAMDAVVPLAGMAQTIVGFCEEGIMPRKERGATDMMKAEIGAARGEARGGDPMRFGPFVANTCPECHGAMSEIREGSIIRYRCHTGHAFTLDSLYELSHTQIGNSLWNALRAIDERIVLAQRLERQARGDGETKLAEAYGKHADLTKEWGRRVRDVILDVGLQASETIPPPEEYPPGREEA